MTSSIRANMLALAGISLFWWGLLGLSGNLTTGYNLRDDHQILQIAAEVKADGIAATTRHWVAHDYRFRPVYFGHRICEVIVLGDNLLSWSIYTAFLGFLSSSLFYLAFRALGFSSLESLTFVFFALVGPQGEVWWRRGTNETIGMVFVALTSLALAWSARSRSPISRVTFFAAAMVMSCCKESFILLLPAILLALVWAVRSAFGMSWKEAARTCSAELVGLLSVMVAELALIKLSLGTEVMGYAGIEDITLAQVWRTGWRLVRIGNVWWAIAGMWVLILLTSRRRWPGRDGLVPGALTLLIVVPQAWLHAKSGVFGRYYLPGALGIAILLGCCMRAWRQHPPLFHFLEKSLGSISRGSSTSESSRGASARLAFRLSPTALLVGIVLFSIACGQTGRMYRSARAWAEEGTQQQRFIDSLVTSCPYGPILISGGLPGVYEYFLSLRVYLEHRSRRSDTYFYFVHPDGPLVQFEEEEVWDYRTTRAYKTFNPATDSVDFTCVAILAEKNDEAMFLSRAAGWFRPEDYARRQVGSDRYPYVIYARR